MLVLFLTSKGGHLCTVASSVHFVAVGSAGSPWSKHGSFQYHHLHFLLAELLTELAARSHDGHG